MDKKGSELKQISFVKFMRVVVFAFLFPYFAYGQNVAPQWIKEDWRSANYPSEFWYVGFSQNTLPAKADAASALKQVERDAQSQLAQGISVRISGVSSMETRALDGGSLHTLSTDFKEKFQAEIDAELTKTSVRSYYDAQTNKVYAFAAVKKSDLAAFYVSKIESALDETRRGIELSTYLSELDKKKEALRKLDESKNVVDSAAYYRTLLIAVDTQNGLKRSQTERTNELLKEIAALRAQIEAGAAITVFVTGTESIQNKTYDIIVSGLQTLLSENDVTITENEKEAEYVLKIDAKICSQGFDGRFHYANACVKAALINVKTGKNETLINVNEKGGGLNAEKAGQDAFKYAVAQVWAKVKDKVLQN